jgi:hypothetical protein
MISLLLALEPVTREGARQAAGDELSKGAYRAERPGLVTQLIDQLLTLLQNGLQKGADAAPGGLPGLVALALVVVAVVVVVRLRSGPLARRTRVGDPFGGFAERVSPEQHRRRADEHAAAGRYAEAVRERIRAIISDLEERVVLEPRLGRTADEVAAEAGAVLPDAAGDLQRAARIFDDVWYGKRPATAAMAGEMRDVDRRVQAARAGSAGSAPVPGRLAVPR